ncbi:MAG: hypothetical protein KOO62_03295 [candidate division Zixibacteria bacterium]|nr:hypothetical protein [candidate division Zixibacteria bacterium]
MTASLAYNFVDLTGGLLNGDRGSAPDRFTCKFMIVRGPDEIVMILGSLNEYPYHANLLDQFCHRRELASIWAREPDVVDLHEPGYDILGGGYVEIQRAEWRLRFSGASTAYGAFPQYELNALVDHCPVFEPYQIMITS